MSKTSKNIISLVIILAFLGLMAPIAQALPTYFNHVSASGILFVTAGIVALTYATYKLVKHIQTQA